MTGHDPLCFEVDPWQQCICGQIERARADERERIAQAIEEYATTMDERWGHVSPVSAVLYNAARIARGEGR